MMVDTELSARRDRNVSKLVKQARFKQPSACIEDMIYLPERTLNKDRLARGTPSAIGCRDAR